MAKFVLKLSLENKFQIDDFIAFTNSGIELSFVTEITFSLDGTITYGMKEGWLQMDMCYKPYSEKGNHP